MTTETHPLEGWDINGNGGSDWVDWGEGRLARGKVLASGDGYLVVLVEAEPGYTGTAHEHEHEHTEFTYVLDGELRNQGQPMHAGGAFVAAAGSQHTDFEALTPASYVTIFKL